jgi:CHAT domain-containing protein
MTTVTDTVRLLATANQCTDAAVAKLEALARPGSDPRILSDLSAAYYIRAQRKDHPSDFVRSLDAADRSVALAPAMTEARFNRALAQEALGFSADAIESWDALRNESQSSWAAEAGAHHDRLTSEGNRAAAFAWSQNKERLPSVAGLGDRAAVRQLVTPYPSSAQRYVEEVVLPAWAQASTEKRADDAAAQLRLAEMIASALGQFVNDRYLLDVVDRIRSTRDPHAAERLRTGHLAFGTGRALQRDLTSAAAAYERAAIALAAAGSPLRFEAMLGSATVLTQAKLYESSLALLRTVERESRERQYPSLLARVHTGRAYLFMAQRYDIDALAEYSEAQLIYERIRDKEGVASVRSITIGLYRRIGHENLTWGAAYQAQRHAADLVEAQSRHVYLAENALSAVALGYPSVALHYQSSAVRMLEDELSDSGATANLGQLRNNLGIALRARAGIYLHLDNRAAAQVDLAASTRLLTDARNGEGNDSIPFGFRARLAEIDAQSLAGTDRRQAIAKLSEAIRLSSLTVYQTLVASLRLQRAELYRLDGEHSAAAEDLREAITLLRAEERAALEDRGTLKPALEELWSSYFARSQDAYRRLIRLYVEDGAEAEAFEYAERARAYEPLHLVLRRTDLPSSFLNRIHDGEPYRLEDVEQIVPDGTFLLQYSVLEDQTYVWMIGKGFSGRRTLSVGESAIREWTRSLQRLAESRDGDRFNTVLAIPYKALLEEPLALIAKRPHGRNAKIVIVPDRSMHGLPFSALRNGGRFLIQDHSVSVAASASLYAFSLAQDAQQSYRQDQSVLLFADPEFNSQLGVTHDLHRLPNARNEVARIRSVYAGAASVGPPRMDGDATVPAFLRLAAESTIVHLAVHGVANPEIPSRSFLLLAPTGDDKGVIDAERLLKQLQLRRTRLAVLSACSSAGGTPVGPEGLAPLVRPFVAAGVPGVVGTLWDVSDSFVTEDLLVQFHQHYRDGHDADEALRMAQGEMLTSKGPGAAWAWSAFQLYGSASSPFPASADESRRSP